LNWQNVHDAILEYVLAGLRQEGPEGDRVRALIQAWDEELFPETETSIVGAQQAPSDMRSCMLAGLGLNTDYSMDDESGVQAQSSGGSQEEDDSNRAEAESC